MQFLFLIFIVVPLIEMLLLFEVSDRIGGLSTLGLVVATAVIGVQVLKQQGFATLTRANSRLNSGELPAQEIVEGMLLAAAGALLLTPGFITDTLGFLFLTGPLRRSLAARLIRSGRVSAVGTSRFGFQSGFTMRGGFDSESDSTEGGDIIEGEVVEECHTIEEKINK